MKSLALVIIALAASGYIGVCWLLYARQDLLLYPGAADSNPAGYKSLRIRSGGELIKVWSLNVDAGPALLYFGGNGEDVGANLADFERAFPARAIYFMNYRGYGGSTGTPSESALIADAQATFDELRRTHGKIAVMGRSLGSGVAAALIATRDVEKAILVTPFDSIANVAAERYRWAPVRWLIKDSYDSMKRVALARVPILLVIAAHDESILRVRSEALLAAIPEGLGRAVVMPNGSHNDLGDYQQYLAIVRNFLDGRG
ncbi:MAG: hypothetical protein WDO56_18045 [Gammaproteobacteria bacterium]